MSGAVCYANDSLFSPDPQVNQARGLIEKKQYKHALSLLRHKIDQQKTIAHQHDVLFLIGIASIRLAENTPLSESEDILNLAIASFRRILIDNPRLVRVRLELAYAFFLKHEDELAKEHFEIVLADDPVPAMAHNIRRFLQKIQKRKRLGGYFSFSIAPSTNINSGTDNKVIYLLDNIPFQISEESRQKSGIGFLTRGGIDYEYPFANSWRWITGVDLSHSEYGNSQFDNSSLFFRSGVRYLLSNASNIKIQGNVGGVWQAHQRQYRSYGLRLDGSHRITQKWYLQGSSSWQKRTYRVNSDYNGNYVSYNSNLSYLLNSLWRINFGGGVSYDRPHSINARNRRWNLSLGAISYLPHGWVISSHIQKGGTQYQGRWSSVPNFSSRSDSQLIYHAGVFNQNLVIGGFSPKLSLIREKNDSNSLFNQYNRNRAELTFIRQF